MRSIRIDCSGVTSCDEFWQLSLDATQPEGAQWFGRNLDALWDAVEGGGPGWPGEVRLVFTHVDELAPLRTRGGSSLLEGLRKIAAESTRIDILLD